MILTQIGLMAFWKKVYYSDKKVPSFFHFWTDAFFADKKKMKKVDQNPVAVPAAVKNSTCQPPLWEIWGLKIYLSKKVEMGE